MNRNFLGLYNNELHHLREVAGEFAREFPKIAGRLAIDKDAKEECQDPFVERLLEGFAYVAARVQLKLDAEFPRFTQSLIETVYPHYLCPTPSMAVVRMEPDPQSAGTPEGFLIPRGSVLRGATSSSDTACEFRSAHDVRIWPLRVAEAKSLTRSMAELGLPDSLRGKAAIRIRLQANAGVKLKTLELERLPVFVRGLNETPSAIFEQIFARATHVIVRTTKANGNVCHVLPATTLRRAGLREDEGLLPFAPRGFEGYRLIHEYFSMPERFLFFEFTELREAIGKCDCEQADIIILLRDAEARLENVVDAESFDLFCTPIINLFPKRLDPISLGDRFSEYHAVADRTRPLDFEIYQIQQVVGQGAAAESQQIFQPFYLARDLDLESAAYFNAHRVPRVLSAREKQFGATSSYTGSEVYISLVDGQAAPYRADLAQINVRALCSNRHLPIQLITRQGRTDFQLDLFAPVSAIRCVAGPTDPQPAHPDGEIAWRVISHMSLNYLSLLNAGGDAGPSGLREMLKLYCNVHDIRSQKQVDGIVAAQCRPVIRRVEASGPLTFGRGLEVAVEFDEHAFEGSGIFILGSVLEQFFARYVSLNSFTETVIRSQQRGDIIRWPAHPGKKPII
ncbi:MAG: type VI secretion system baseplate subunit TssF [Chthoniobacteraceae bacterium]